jgi:hypothetical protein
MGFRGCKPRGGSRERNETRSWRLVTKVAVPDKPGGDDNMIDAATRFAIRLAERVSPDEVDLAPALLASAREGGEAWRRATARDGGVVVGGMHGVIELLGMLHLNFDSLKFCVEAAVVGIHATELRVWIREHIVGTSAVSEPARPAGAKATQFIDQVAARLEAKGLAKPEAQRNADVIGELLAENPEDGAEFLEALAHAA